MSVKRVPDVFVIRPGVHEIRSGRHHVKGALYLPSDGAGHLVVSAAGGTLDEYLTRYTGELPECFRTNLEGDDGAARSAE